MSRVIGIDLGTTNSAVAVMEGGSPVVIANVEGSRTTPSVVYFPGGGDEVIVGELAKRMLIPEPKRAIKSIKRFMGLRYSETEEQRLGVHYDLTTSERDDVRVSIGGRELTPEIVSSEVLKKMRDTAEAYLGEPVEHAVVTVPAYFNDSQRQATKLAGDLAGLEILRIINEPTAACLAYGINSKAAERVVVFDLGGGTFDVSLLDIDNGVFEVKSTCGDNALGGDTFDAMIAFHLEERVRTECGVDPAEDVKARQRVAEAAEKAKCELSTLETTTISLPFIGLRGDEPAHFSTEMTRDQLVDILRPALARIKGPCERALEDAGWRTSDITKILLVGGSTRIPMVRRICEDIFDKAPSHDVNPDEAVAAGAAIQGAVIIGGLTEVLLLDVTPLSLGVSSQGGLFNVLIPRNSNIPTEARKPFTTTRDYQRTVKVAAYQGERKMAAENRLLAQFSLENITPAPKGLPHIDVVFRLDANGILSVGATDLSTGASQEVRIDSFMTSKEEAERIIAAAEAASETDHSFMQRSALNLRAAKLQEAAQMLLDEHGAKMHPEDLKELREVIVRMDVAFHLDDPMKMQELISQMNAVCERQGDDFLMVKTKLGQA